MEIQDKNMEVWEEFARPIHMHYSHFIGALLLSSLSVLRIIFFLSIVQDYYYLEMYRIFN